MAGPQVYKGAYAYEEETTQPSSIARPTLCPESLGQGVDSRTLAGRPAIQTQGTPVSIFAAFQITLRISEGRIVRQTAIHTDDIGIARLCATRIEADHLIGIHIADRSAVGRKTAQDAGCAAAKDHAGTGHGSFVVVDHHCLIERGFRSRSRVAQAQRDRRSRFQYTRSGIRHRAETEPLPICDSTIENRLDFQSAESADGSTWSSRNILHDAFSHIDGERHHGCAHAIERAVVQRSHRGPNRSDLMERGALHI